MHSREKVFMLHIPELAARHGTQHRFCPPWAPPHAEQKGLPVPLSTVLELFSWKFAAGCLGKTEGQARK